MHGYQQGWCGSKEELQGPQADVRHRKEVVIADIIASRLLGVAGEVRLLVPPNALSSQNQDGNAEDEENRQPDLPQTGGVFVDTQQNFIESLPTHSETKILCCPRFRGPIIRHWILGASFIPSLR
uniref:Uncharacterized protein n=1 Tax=Oryzias melastigma TaxID=30732 RepID=A0A3B3BTQ9_ORYME